MSTGGRYSTSRMLIDYVEQIYIPLCELSNKKFKEHPSIAISYDSRINSDVFARVAAEVFAANGIKVYIYPIYLL